MRSYFDELYGNDALKKKISAFIDNETFPHSSMIVGEEGSGRRTLARLIAMALNCEKKSDTSSVPCGRCNPCRRIREGNFPDVKYLRKNAGKATIGVDEIRSFKEDMYLSATESKYKIYVFEDADTLTPQAQNALLISLEEPSKNVVSILIAEHTDKILTTIKSRVQQFTMQRFSPSEISRFLLDTSEDARAMKAENGERFSGILMASGGKIGAAYTLMDDEAAADNEKMRSAVTDLISALSPKAKYETLYRAITDLPTARAELKEVLEALMLALRDLVAIKKDKSAPLLFFTSESSASAASSGFTQKRLITLYDVVCSAYKSTEQNANVTALLTSLAVQIKNS